MTTDLIEAMALIEPCLVASGRGSFVPYLMGPSGIGKTTLTEALAFRRGWSFKAYNCTYADFADWGLHVRQDDGSVECAIPKHMDWLFRSEDGRPTLCLVDELPLAPEIIQGNLMALFSERHIRGRKIRDDLLFIAAGNRPQDKVGGRPLKWPLVSRMAVFEVSVGPTYLSSWLERQLARGVDPLYVSCIEKQPDLLTNAVPNTSGVKDGGDPRSWERLFTTLTRVGKAYEKNRALIESFVGEKNAQHFIGFLSIRAAFPTVEEVLANPDSVCNFSFNTDRPDILYAFGASLAYHANENNIEAVLNIADRFPPEFRNRIAKDISIRDPFLAEHPLVVEFLMIGERRK